MKKLQGKKVFGAASNIIVFIICLILIAVVTVFSLKTIDKMNGNAKVVNYAGIVRGGSQKLFKMELAGAYNDNKGKYGTDVGTDNKTEIDKRDALIRRLTKIINGMQTGNGNVNGENDEEFIFQVIPDKAFQDYLLEIQKQWSVLQDCLNNVRNETEDPARLYDLSEIYFTLCNDTVAAVEKYSESQVTSMRKFLFIVDGIFLLVIISMIILMLYSEITKKRADNLGKLAYIDVLTTMPNRASCEKLIAEIKAIPAENRVSLGLIMFDMNNLKLANDFLGHQGGDIIIKDFGLALKSLAEKYGIFAGRYGGDEFVMIFRGKTESLLKEITGELAVVIEERNKLMKLDVERIQYAYGFGYAPPEEEITIDELIFKADKNMYTYKKNMKNKKSINESE